MKGEEYKTLSQEGFLSLGMRGFLKGIIISSILTSPLVEEL